MAHCRLVLDTCHRRNVLGEQRKAKPCIQAVLATRKPLNPTFCSVAPRTPATAVITDFLAAARPQVWVSDRLAAQAGHADAHQVCLAHLLRDARYAVEVPRKLSSEASDTVFAPGFKFLLNRACAMGRRRDDLTDATLRRYQRDLERRLERLLNGFRSTWGADVYANICSVVATGRLNGQTALDAIRTALASSAPAPSQPDQRGQAQSGGAQLQNTSQRTRCAGGRKGLSMKISRRGR